LIAFLSWREREEDEVPRSSVDDFFLLDLALLGGVLLKISSREADDAVLSTFFEEEADRESRRSFDFFVSSCRREE